MSALYSKLLLVHSNSKRRDRMHCFLCGSMRMQPALEPSCIFEPSKYKVQILSATKLVPMLLLLCTSMLQDSLAPFGLQGRSSTYVYARIGDGGA